jgi:hypothetical protein
MRNLFGVIITLLILAAFAGLVWAVVNYGEFFAVTILGAGALLLLYLLGRVLFCILAVLFLMSRELYVNVIEPKLFPNRENNRTSES